jgi:uncharacterized protein (DUF983 family)
MISISNQSFSTFPAKVLLNFNKVAFSRSGLDEKKNEMEHSSGHQKGGEGSSRTSKVWSIINLKCPRCHRGNLFSETNPYTFKDGMKMPDNCQVCQQDFKIEPGFYIGALWASFPIVIVLMAFFSILLLAVFKMQLEWFFVSITLILLLLQPLIIRIGRSIWIHIFVHHKEFKNE